MGAALSFATCGVFNDRADIAAVDAELRNTVYTAARTLTGARAREQSEQTRFEVLTRVQRNVETREIECETIRGQIKDLARRALRRSAVLKQRPPAPAAVQQDAVKEVRAALRAKKQYEADLGRRMKLLDLARRRLAAENMAKDSDADREFMRDLAALSNHGQQLTDADISEMERTGVEIVEAAADIEEHVDNINAAVYSLNEGASKDGEYDLDNDESLMQALAALEDEVSAEVVAPAPAKSVVPDAIDESLFAAAAVPAGAPAVAAVRDWSNRDSSKQPAQRVAIAETTNGRFGLSEIKSSASTKTTATHRGSAATSSMDYF